ncbi:MAG: PilN domain-containing protein [Candidatus Omnitrophota bacterium]|nr:PilN domain-containing protein [Candidatus Omnitrophota bacterium]MDZ4242528.1 PilN domain-containing protein [Candidatus Omnitrophota bacterium]
MIDINLVPINLRKKRKSVSMVDSTLALPRETMLALAGGVVFLLLAVHILLQVSIAVKFFQLKHYEKQWEQIAGEKTNVDKIIQEMRLLQTKVKAVTEISVSKKILWSKTMNLISDLLPRGVWLTRLTFEEGMLTFQGSAVSKTNTEMTNVHAFMSNLKNSAEFMKSVSSIELGLIKSRKINATSVADFTVTAEMK